MKTDKNFKLSKTTKRLLSSMTDKAQRLFFKNAMIDAEVSYEIAKKRQPRTIEKEKVVTQQ